MKSNNLLVLLLLLFGGTLHAQTVEEQKKQISSVKRSNLYIYGEATAESEQEAKDLAEEILNYEINKWAATQKKLQGTSNFVLNNINEFYTTLSLPRGNMFRSFMYVKKSDIKKADNVSIITNDVTAPGPDITSRVEDVPSQDSSVMPALVEELANISSYTELAAKVMAYKKQGKIKAYNYYAKLDNPTLYYLALYNEKGIVEAILTPGKPRKNAKTGQEDTTNNYPGCGAIGFMLNE